MNTVVELALSNVLMAAMLAVPAVLAGWWGRRPALTHGLWLLVVLKLVTPPLFRVPIALPEPPPPEPIVHQALEPILAPPLAMPEPEPIAPPEVPVPVQPAPAPVNAAPIDVEPALPMEPPPAPATVPEVAATWTDWLMLPWLAGSLAWLLLAARRLDRFHRLLRFARPAPAEVQAEAQTLATVMRVRCPQVLMLPGAVSPMLWAIGRSPRLLVPDELFARLRPAQRATLLAHELAHWRRGDHRVRWLEVVALGLYWWCPLAWWACRQLQQAEEECCDAWVVAVLPEAAREYALALVETIDFLSGAPHALPPAASGVGHVRLLQRRLTMILRGTTPQSLTRAGLCILAGLGLALLPFVPGVAQQPARKDADTADAIVKQLLAEGKLKELVQVQQALAQALKAGDEEKAKQWQAELEHAQVELEKQRRHLEERIEAIRRAMQRFQEQAPAAAPAAGTGAPATGPKTAAKSGVEQRLEQVEKKLDTLLWEVANLRRDLSKAHPAPRGPGVVGPMPRPGDGLPPGPMVPPGSGYGPNPKGPGPLRPDGPPGGPGRPGGVGLPPGTPGVAPGGPPNPPPDSVPPQQ